MIALLDEVATWPEPVRVGIIVLFWGIGIRFGWWLHRKMEEHFERQKSRRAERMRNVTPT